MSEPTYEMNCSTVADGDGDYKVNVFRNNEHVKTFYRKDRQEAISEARAWLARDREFYVGNMWEPIPVEEVTPEPQSLRA